MREDQIFFGITKQSLEGWTPESASQWFQYQKDYTLTPPAQSDYLTPAPQKFRFTDSALYQKELTFRYFPDHFCGYKKVKRQNPKLSLAACKALVSLYDQTDGPRWKNAR